MPSAFAKVDVKSKNFLSAFYRELDAMQAQGDRQIMISLEIKLPNGN
jgi:hypothetical protein